MDGAAGGSFLLPEDVSYTPVAGPSLSRPSRGKNATPKELADMLSKTLRGSSMLLVAWLELEEDAVMSEAEGTAIAEPMARMLNRQKWARRAVKMATDNADAFALIYAVGAYGLRVYPAVAVKLSNPEAHTRVHTHTIRQPSPQAATPSRPSRGGDEPNYAGGPVFAGVDGYDASYQGLAAD